MFYTDLFYVKGKKNLQELIMTTLVPILIGVLTFLLIKNYTADYSDWIKGTYAPPIMLYAVMWPFLLVAMGIASYRIKLSCSGSNGHIYYALQLLTAFIWNITFFRFRLENVSFIIIILCLIFLTATFFEFDKIDKKGGYLILPAVLWAICLAFVNYFCLHLK